MDGAWLVFTPWQSVFLKSEESGKAGLHCSVLHGEGEYQSHCSTLFFASTHKDKVLVWPLILVVWEQ